MWCIWTLVEELCSWQLFFLTFLQHSKIPKLTSQIVALLAFSCRLQWAWTDGLTVACPEGCCVLCCHLIQMFARLTSGNCPAHWHAPFWPSLPDVQCSWDLSPRSGRMLLTTRAGKWMHSMGIFILPSRCCVLSVPILLCICLRTVSLFLLLVDWDSALLIYILNVML